MNWKKNERKKGKIQNANVTNAFQFFWLCKRIGSVVCVLQVN